MNIEIIICVIYLNEREISNKTLYQHRWIPTQWSRGQDPGNVNADCLGNPIL